MIADRQHGVDGVPAPEVPPTGELPWFVDVPAVEECGEPLMDCPTGSVWPSSTLGAAPTPIWASVTPITRSDTRSTRYSPRWLASVATLMSSPRCRTIPITDSRNSTTQLP
jgi:hypothetical protein